MAWEFFKEVKEAVDVKIQRYQLQRELRDLKEKKDKIKFQVDRLASKKQAMLEQLALLEADDVSGNVELRYESREDYQARVDSTRRKLSNYDNLEAGYQLGPKLERYNLAILQKEAEISRLDERSESSDLAPSTSLEGSQGVTMRAGGE